MDDPSGAGGLPPASRIRTLGATPPDDFEDLRALAVAEGYAHLDRLADEWRGGLRDYVVLFGALAPGAAASLVGVGGLTPCPFRPGAGRVRRLYVAPSARGSGAGAALLAAIEQAARGRFRTLTLRTHSAAADAWYSRRGYARVPGEPGVTHQLGLTPDPAPHEDV